MGFWIEEKVEFGISGWNFVESLGQGWTSAECKDKLFCQGVRFLEG